MKSLPRSVRAALGAAVSLSLAPFVAAIPNVWINEIHYDNSGADVDEFVEVAGPAGLDLSGFSLILYNGNNGAPYDTVNLAGILGNAINGFGFFAATFSEPLQNGPDGVALTWSGSLVQFLSYEGTFAGSSGAALGANSSDIGVSESSSPVGTSLQLGGLGSAYGDFAWQTSATGTPGAANLEQSFPALSTPPPTSGGRNPVPDATSTLWLAMLGLPALLVARTRHRA